MIGAICGDILGSIYETIPDMPRRLSKEPTDDSMLTCACEEWVQSLHPMKVQIYFTHPSFVAQQDQLIRDISKSAVMCLKKWFHIYPSVGFSKSFSAWARESETSPSYKRTNGALMRQSPIAAWCVKNQINLEVCQKLSSIFASTTHDHLDVYPSVNAHTTLIYHCLEKLFDETSIKDCLETLPVVWRDGNQTPPANRIQSLDYWRSARAFLWDAPRSFEIMKSVLYHADSFQDTIDNCIYVGGDVDTYAAIAGPVAEAVWGIPQNILKEVKNVLTPYPEVRDLFKTLS